MDHDRGDASTGSAHILNVEMFDDVAIPDIVQNNDDLLCKDALQGCFCAKHTIPVLHKAHNPSDFCQ